MTARKRRRGRSEWTKEEIRLLLPEFDAKTCTGCGQCVESCPEDALSILEDTTTPIIDPELCTGCGKCETVCSLNQRAVNMKEQEITDWQKGERTLPLRMVDYTVGLMNGRWDRTIHVLHMYTVTERCDCLNITQEPLVEKDRGFLIGKNPFAIDLIASRLLAAALDSGGINVDRGLLRNAKTSAEYARDTYGILVKAPLEKVAV